MLEAPSRTIRKLRLALVSEARSPGYAVLASNPFSVDMSTSSPYSMIQLEHVASLLHSKFEDLGGHLEQVPYVHAIWRVQL